MTAPTPASPPLSLSDEHPYPGLLSFRPEDEHFFWGRGAEMAALLRTIRRERVTVLFGRSGVGKSSLLQAGLMPKARQSGFLPIHVRVRWTPPGVDATAAPEGGDTDKASAYVFAQILEPLRAAAAAAGLTERASGPAPQRLWAFLHAVTLVDSAGNAVIPVLLLDQFEELFRAPLHPEIRARIVRDLGDLLERYVPGDLAADPDDTAADPGDLAADPDDTAADLDDTGAELSTVIVDEDSVDWRFAARQDRYRIVVCLREDFLPDLEQFAQGMPSLCESRIRLTAMTRDQARAAISGPGANVLAPGVEHDILRFLETSTDGRLRRDGNTFEPVMLALVCYQLNELRLRRREQKITSEVITSLGPRILRDFYDGAVTEASARKFIEDELVTEGGLRRPVLEADATAVSPTELEQLIARRIIRRESWNNQPCLELIHDRLCAPVQASRDERLREAARITAEQDRKRARNARIRWVAVPLALLALVFLSVRVSQAVKDAQAAELARIAREGVLGDRLKDEMAERHFVRARLLALAALDRFDLDHSYNAHSLWYQAMPRWPVETIRPGESPFSQFVSTRGYFVAQTGDRRLVRFDQEGGMSSPPQWLTVEGELPSLTRLVAKDKYLAASDVDGVLHVWNDHELVGRFPGPRPDVTALSLGANADAACVAVTYGNGHLEVFDLLTGQPVLDEVLPRAASALALRLDCSRVAVGSSQGVRVIDIRNGKAVDTPGTVRELAWFDNGLLLAGAVGLYTWTADQRDPVALFSGPVDTMLRNDSLVYWSSYDEEGSMLYSKSLQGRAEPRQLGRTRERVTNIQSCGPLLLLSGQHGSIYELNAKCETCLVTELVQQEVAFRNGVGFCPLDKNGFTRVVSLDREGQLRQNQPLLLDQLLGSDVRDVHYQRAQELMVLTRERLFRGDETQLRTSLKTTAAIDIHPGSDLVAATAPRRVELWRPTEQASDKLLEILEMKANPSAIKFTRDGKHLFAIGRDGALAAWAIGGDDPDAPRFDRLSESVPGTLAADFRGELELSEDGKRGMIVATGEIHVFALPDGATVRKWPTNGASHARLDPGGREVVTFGPDEVRVEDVESDRERFRYPHPEVQGGAYSRSGRLLASFAKDGTIEVWDTRKRSRVWAYKKNAMPVSGLEFRPDEQAFVAAGQQGQFWLYTLVSDEPAVFDMKTGRPVVAARWSPNGQRLLVASGPRLRLWELDPRQLKIQGCKQVSRNLTRDEWAGYFGPDDPIEASCPEKSDPTPAGDFRRNIYCDVPLKCRVRRTFLREFAENREAMAKEGTFSRVKEGWELVQMKDDGILKWAGFRLGDVVVQLNDVRFAKDDQWTALLTVAALLPKIPDMDRASIGFRRGGRELSLEVVAVD